MFPYSLADDQWHKVSVAVSASHVVLHVDCNRWEAGKTHMELLLTG